MSLETSRHRLVKHLREACDKLAGLERIVGDHPPHDDAPALIEQLGETVLDAHGRVEDALAEAARLAGAPAGAPLTDLARSALPAIQHAIHHAIFDCLLRLASPGSSVELVRIARLRGGEWAGWTSAIRPVLAESVRLLEPAHAAVGECWCDLFDRAGASAPRVHQVVNICHRDPGLAPANLEPIPSNS